MLRKIMMDYGRFRKDDIHNYPNNVWEKIAHDSAKSRLAKSGLRIVELPPVDVEKELGRFSIPVADEVRNMLGAAAARIRRREARGLSVDASGLHVV